MSETMPPLTPDDVKKDLNNPTFSVYLYIGSKDDEGWENAELAFGLLARLRIYLVKSHSLVKEWINDKKPYGVVFGFGPKPYKLLNKAEAEDFKTVINTILEARKEA